MNQFDICPVAPTKIYEALQVIGFEGFFWFEAFLIKPVLLCQAISYSFIFAQRAKIVSHLHI